MKGTLIQRNLTVPEQGQLLTELTRAYAALLDAESSPDSAAAQSVATLITSMARALVPETAPPPLAYSIGIEDTPDGLLLRAQWADDVPEETRQKIKLFLADQGTR